MPGFLLGQFYHFFITSDNSGQFGVSSSRQFGVGSSILLPLHQVSKLDSWEDFQDRQAMTLFTTRSTAGTTEPMSSAPTANGILPRQQRRSHTNPKRERGSDEIK